MTPRIISSPIRLWTSFKRKIAFVRASLSLYLSLAIILTVGVGGILIGKTMRDIPIKWDEAIGVLAIATVSLGAHYLERRGRNNQAAVLFGSGMTIAGGVFALVSHQADVGIFMSLLALAFMSPYLSRRLLWITLPSLLLMAVGLWLAVGLPDGGFSSRNFLTVAIVFLLMSQRHAISEAGRRLAQMIESLPTAVFRTHPDGYLLEANGSYQRLIGASDRATLMSTPVNNFYANPEDRIAMMSRLLADGECEGTVQLRRFDGKLIWGRYHLHVARDSRGQVKWYEGTMYDVTAQYQAAEASTRLASLVSSASEAIISLDREGKITSWNAAAERIFGYNALEVVGGPVAIVVPERRRRSLVRLTERVLSGRDVGRFEIELRHANQSPVYVMTAMSPLRDADEHVQGVSIIASDTTATRKLQLRMSREAEQRAQAVSAIQHLRPEAHAVATAEAICEAIVVNAGFATAEIIATASDGKTRLLATSGLEGKAKLISLNANSSRYLGLLQKAVGGPWLEDVLHQGTGAQQEAAREQRLTWLAHAPLFVGHEILGLLIVGIANHENDEAVESLPVVVQLAAASSVLLAAQLRSELDYERTADQIRDVISQQSFWPVFQPIIELASGQIVGYEALTRFADNTRPDIMFERAAAAGLGLELELATLKAAFAAAEGLPGDVFVDFNASAELIMAGDELRNLIAAHKVRATVEVTEHTAVADYDRLRTGVANLGANVPLAIDDAGAGYAGLQHILELRPDFLKLDRSLVSGVNIDPSRQAMAAGMAHFANSTGARLIAEGVESQLEANSLADIGIELGQGYVFGRPERVEHWHKINEIVSA